MTTTDTNPMPEPAPELAPEPDAKPAAKPEAEAPRLTDFKTPIVPPSTAVPGWAIVPKGLPVPKGRQAVFMRFRASMTEAPHKGERQIICWTLTDHEEKLANQRAQNNPDAVSSEYAKQMIRAIDGVVADWGATKGAGSVDEFWREVGPKGRNLIIRVFTQLHHASEAELADFFEDCIAVATAS